MELILLKKMVEIQSDIQIKMFTMISSRLIKKTHFSTFNMSYDFYLELDEILSKGSSTFLIKCPCCKSLTCETGIRLKILNHIEISSYFLDKNHPKLLEGISSEEIIRLQMDLLRGYIIPLNMKLYVLPSNNRYNYWELGCLLTSSKKFKIFNQVNYYERILVLKIDKKDLLVFLALGPIIRSILISKDLFHPNSFLVDNMKEDFYSSVLTWDNVDVLYCIDISLNIPNFSRKEVLNKLEQLINKDSYLYKLCIQYISLKIRYINENIEFGILAFDCIQLSYLVNELLLDSISWGLDKMFPGCRFSRGYTSIFITSISGEVDKDKIEILLSELSFEGKIYQIKDGEGFLNLWNKRININNGKIKMINNIL